MIFNGTLSVNVINLNSILLFTILVIFSSVFSSMYIEIYATFDSRVYIVPKLIYIWAGAKQLAPGVKNRTFV